MVKLTIRHLNSEAFHNALNKLATYKKFEFKTSYKLYQLMSKIISETRTAQSIYQKWSEEFLEKGPDGKPIASSKEEAAIYGTPYKIKEENKDQFLSKMKEFLDLEVELAATKISPKEMKDFELSPIEFGTLAPIFYLEEQ